MKNKKLPSIIVLLILTAITSIFWVSFSIYRVFTSKPGFVIPEEIIKPLDPRLDSTTLDLIQERQNQ